MGYIGVLVVSRKLVKSIAWGSGEVKFIKNIKNIFLMN